MRKWSLLIVLIALVSAATWRIAVAVPPAEVSNQDESRKLAEAMLLKEEYPGLQLGDDIVLYLNVGNQTSLNYAAGTLKAYDGRQFFLSGIDEMTTSDNRVVRRTAYSRWVPKTSVLYIDRSKDLPLQPTTQP